MKNSSILLSGGMDSIAMLYWYRYDISLAITIDYGQPSAEKELSVSKKVCEELNIASETIILGCSDLFDYKKFSNIKISNNEEWWPFRNQLLITLASIKAIQHGAGSILIGSVITDGHYLDGTGDFFEKFNNVVNYQEGDI